jgi:hypothetical protein
VHAGPALAALAALVVSLAFSSSMLALAFAVLVSVVVVMGVASGVLLVAHGDWRGASSTANLLCLWALVIGGAGAAVRSCLGPGRFLGGSEKAEDTYLGVAGLGLLVFLAVAPACVRRRGPNRAP